MHATGWGMCVLPTLAVTGSTESSRAVCKRELLCG